MQTALTSLQNPRWVNSQRTEIDCEITTLQFGNEILPFTASANDPEQHGRLIFADIVAGKYGPIAEPESDTINSSAFPTPPSGQISIVTFEG